MSAGILPLALYIAWAAAFLLTTVPGQPPAIPIIDPIGMLGLGMVVYLTVTGRGRTPRTGEPEADREAALES